jgi:excisionase family DNA binding protein
VTTGELAVTVVGLGLGYARSQMGSNSVSYLTLVEVSQQTGLERSWLRRLCQRGDLPAIKAGRDWLVRQEDVAMFVRQHNGRR